MVKVIDLFKDADTEAWVEEYDGYSYICLDDVESEGVDLMIDLTIFKKIAKKVKELFGE